MMSFKNVQYFNLVHAHKPKFRPFFRLPVLIFFLAPFISFFSALFKVATFRVSYSFWLLLKSWVLLLGIVWKWDLDQL